MVREPTVGAPRLSDLRSAGPADASLQHLLQTLSSKLELYERLAIFEYEASLERHASAATAFRELAVTERRSCEDLVRHLRLHLDETVDVEQASAPRPAPGQPTMPEEGSRG